LSENGTGRFVTGFGGGGFGAPFLGGGGGGGTLRGGGGGGLGRLPGGGGGGLPAGGLTMVEALAMAVWLSEAEMIANCSRN